jgi:predicted metal-dependent peptidase
VSNSESLDVEQRALERAKQALRLASASLPHLAGLAQLVRLKPSRRVSAAGVAASGLILVQPDVFAEIPLGEAAFILAHELMHLALDTHGRQGDADPLLANFAHDYVINDILREELERDPPLDGLNMEGARQKSFEQLVIDLNKAAGSGPGMRCWSPARWPSGVVPGAGQPTRSPMSLALEDAGLIPPQREEPQAHGADPCDPGDVIAIGSEEEFEPEIDRQVRQRLTDQVRKAAAKAASLAAIREQMQAVGTLVNLTEPQRGEAMMRALRDAYSTPWQLALQRWMDAVAPGKRTYARPSRRGSGQREVVLPGRRRDGWTLHIVLDTSGSMVDHLPKALGAIAFFCEASGVTDVHVVQCDVEVTSDEWVEPQQLAEFKVAGFGYSNMSPAMNHLIDDPNVEAVLVLTDGHIDYLADPPPYRILWGLIGEINSEFAPPYGELLSMVPLAEASEDLQPIGTTR